MINASSASPPLRIDGLFNDDLATIRESDPRRAAQIAAAQEYERKAAARTKPKLMSVEKMEEIIGEVVSELAGDAGVRARAKAAGYREVTLTGCYFRPTEVLGKHTIASFRKAVEAALTGDGGAITSYRIYQEGTWIPVGYEIVRSYAVAEEPARRRAPEGEWVDVPEEKMLRTVPVATETLVCKVRVIDISGRENTVYASDGSGRPVDAPRVNVQVGNVGGSGSNDETVAILMQQIAAMQAKMAEMSQAQAQPAAPPRRRPGRPAKGAVPPSKPTEG